MKNFGNYNKFKEYNGNLFWLFEALKNISKEYNLNIKSDFDNSKIKEFKFYECLILNEEKEDALYIQIKDKLYEYLSNDRFNLILKLIKLFKKRVSDLNSLNTNIELPKINLSRIENEDVKIKNISSSLYSNLMITYKDNSSKIIYFYFSFNSARWKYDCDLKKFLFNFKFLPDYKKVKSIRIFPVNIKVFILFIKRLEIECKIAQLFR